MPARLHEVVTAVPVYYWDPLLQMFETRIVAEDELGNRVVVSRYYAPPHVFLACHAAMGVVLKDFDQWKAASADNVVVFRQAETG